MEDNKLELLWLTSLLVLFLSNGLFVIFSEIEMWVAACVALGVFILSLVTWLVLAIVNLVRFRKQVKKWKQGHY